MKTRDESRRIKAVRVEPYWRARSLSSCGGRAAASTPRPSAAGPGPSRPARREPPRPPGPGARTPAAQPPAPGWPDELLGPPDSRLGNTMWEGEEFRMCNVEASFYLAFTSNIVTNVLFSHPILVLKLSISCFSLFFMNEHISYIEELLCKTLILKNKSLCSFRLIC